MPRTSSSVRSRSTRRRWAAAAGAAALAATTLAACGSTDSGGPATLTWYVNPDGEDTNRATAERCSTDQYTIDVQLLPTDATNQRVQAARRLAAHDPGIDLMSLDPVFVPEFANAGFLAEVPSANREQAVGSDVVSGIAKTVQWEGKVYAIPQWANTQVLWYNKALAKKGGLDMSKPVTWDQVIDAAVKGGGTVGVQAKKYEAYAVLINALVMGAGGQIATDLSAGSEANITLDSQAGRDAAAVIEKLAHSDAAQSDLSNSNEGTVEAYLSEPEGTFMVNWTYIYSSYAESVKDLGYARYPQTVPGRMSRPPIGGIDIGVSAYSDDLEYAQEAAACVADHQSQLDLATTDGLMPASASLYDSPELAKAYPKDLLDLFQQSLETGGPRPPSAVWNDMSLAIQSSWHSPYDVTQQTPAESAQYIADVLTGKALV